MNNQRTLRMARLNPRRGASMVLILIMLVIFIIMAGLTIDYAYIQLIRTDLRTVADAAAKAGAEALGRTENEAAARLAAVQYAALNTVGEAPFQIQESDVTVGRLVPNHSDGRWQFVAGGTPPNAVQVNAAAGNGALHPAIPLFFAKATGVPTFSPSIQTTAGQQEVEVVLCLDRSGSMLFDMSGVDYEYPPNNPNLSTFTAWGWIWQNHLSPPHPVNSRWAVLARAVDLFMDESGYYTPPPRVSLVTWSSNYTMPISPGTQYLAATVNVALPSIGGHSWSSNRQAVLAAVSNLGSKPMMGATNLSAGLGRAAQVLGGNNANSFSNKIIILLTDGEWNEGRGPLAAAIDARNAGITVHCITVLTAHQPDIQQVALLTGGRYFNTYTEQELKDAFQEVARSLPIVMTD